MTPRLTSIVCGYLPFEDEVIVREHVMSACESWGCYGKVGCPLHEDKLEL
ncbi:hypothetical protein LCGC14_0850020 [marine sediment metagenome]|uniref:Uncharacterized protein n=1 Tax=marine sediment metagenome TaxID=412755 RepID=A0A0F9PVW6_9ZZZZ